MRSFSENWGPLQGAGVSHESVDALSVAASACSCSGKSMVPREDGKPSEALADGDIQLNIGGTSDVIATAAGFLKIFAGAGGADFDLLAAACVRFAVTDVFDMLLSVLLEMHRCGIGGSAGRGVRGAAKSTSSSSPSHMPTMHSPRAFG